MERVRLLFTIFIGVHHFFFVVGTDFSYGPWADRQREHLFKFFYPPDYLPMEITKTPKPGDKRQMQSFDIRLSLQNESTFDILFSKNKETNAVHVNVGAGSYMDITVPWVTIADGYTTKVNGQVLHFYVVEIRLDLPVSSCYIWTQQPVFSFETL